MVLLRRELGDTLRSQRQRQSRTLREVSSAARVSLGYLSEVERGHKEASSELLAAICDALDVRLADVLREVSENLDRAQGATPVPVVGEDRVRGPRAVRRTNLQEVVPAGGSDAPADTTVVARVVVAA